MSLRTEKALLYGIQTLFGLLLTIAIGLSTYGLSQVDELQDRVTAIESKQFTNADALDVWKEIASIKQDVALGGSSAQNIVDRLERFESSVKTQLDKLEVQIRERGN